MTIYEAIEQMRALSAKGESFSFSFLSYSYDKNQSQGIVQVPHARLTRQSTKEHNRWADYMLNFMDLDLMETRRCWQPLMLEFNGQELTING